MALICLVAVFTLVHRRGKLPFCTKNPEILAETASSRGLRIQSNHRLRFAISLFLQVLSHYRGGKSVPVNAGYEGVNGGRWCTFNPFFVEAHF